MKVSSLSFALCFAACAGQPAQVVCPAAPASEITLAQMDERFRRLEERLEEIAQTNGEMARALAETKTKPTSFDRKRPDPSIVYSIAVGDSPSVGSATAKVTIIRAFEFACPFCEKSRATMNELMKKYGSDLRIVYKNMIVHPQAATQPALAACAAHRQGKYKVMEELLWEKGFLANRNFSPENISALAREAGLKMDKFEVDRNARCRDIIANEQKEVAAVGVSGTPSFFINGRFLSGAQPIDKFEHLIDEELAKANHVIGKNGVSSRNYYQKMIVEAGKKTLD